MPRQYRTRARRVGSGAAIRRLLRHRHCGALKVARRRSGGGRSDTMTGAWAEAWPLCAAFGSTAAMNGREITE
ncbi:hypothetical protein PATSB16_14620 [Pandoraea thiooxydans]|uniref:Uncharacterized protein n=1 Tax=Pandoraea thiooxydans TaxID=445709 RepID=A0A0G3EKV6_9BURK|nr:hypothetical protein ABW99_05030 [Pandoraea thiooxydans]APR94804.1 hypothetical protein PATSB16_14620 [Pandoraea thiooxydans]